MSKLIISNEVLLPEVAGMLAEGLIVTLPVTGNSMLPFIVGGKDSVVLQKQAVPLQKGEIVLARTDAGNYVIHRILACNEHCITLMGDGNLCGTETCLPENVLGIVIKIIKGKRYIDCRLPSARRKAELWYKLLPVRRYLLAVYRRVILR